MTRFSLELEFLRLEDFLISKVSEGQGLDLEVPFSVPLLETVAELCKQILLKAECNANNCNH